MIHRFPIRLSTLVWMLISASAPAFNVDSALTPVSGISMQNQSDNQTAVSGIPHNTTNSPYFINKLFGFQQSHSNALQQNTSTGLYLMFNLPAAQPGATSVQNPTSRPFYFDIFDTNAANGASKSNSGIFTGWVECEVCRSIFEIEYEKFVNCDKQLFFGWC